MTRMVMVKPGGVGGVSFGSVFVGSKEAFDLKPGMNFLSCDWSLQDTYGGHVTGFSFQLVQGWAEKGLVLAGAYLDSNAGLVKMIVHNLSGHEMNVPANAEMVEAQAYETIRFRQALPEQA